MNTALIENKNRKLKVAILGATGLVGQSFVHLLSQHPYFQIAALCASEKRKGKSYGEQTTWLLPFPMPQSVSQRNLEILDSEKFKEQEISFVFSALPAREAQEIEPLLRQQGFFVFSNASALRYQPEVPILIPEVNPEALEDIHRQGYPQKGFVITNANCSTTGLALALAPLRPLGLKEIFVSTYQSISGAGYPGVPALDIMGNAIPFIPNEEEKMIAELQKILAVEAEIFPHCVRVPVPFGHLETVWLSFDQPVEPERILKKWQAFRFPASHCPERPSLSPLSPIQPVHYIPREHFPQPHLSFWGTPPGMQVFTGRLRKVKNKIGFTLLVNNLIRGAAGGSIQNAELFVNKKYQEEFYYE